MPLTLGRPGTQYVAMVKLTVKLELWNTLKADLHGTTLH